MPPRDDALLYAFVFFDTRAMRASLLRRMPLIFFALIIDYRCAAVACCRHAAADARHIIAEDTLMSAKNGVELRCDDCEER